MNDNILDDNDLGSLDEISTEGKININHIMMYVVAYVIEKCASNTGKIKS